MTDHSEKKAEAPSLATKTAWSACGSVCRAGGSFLCGIVVARQLGPESFGSCAYLTWLATTLAVLTNLGLPATLSRYLAEFGPKADESWKFAFQRRLLKIFLITLTFGCAVIFGLGEMYGTARYSVPVLALLVMFFALQGLGTFYLESLAGRQRFHIAARINCLSSLLQVAGILIGSTLFNLEGALAGYALGWLLPACLCLRLLRRPMSEAAIDVAVVRRVRRFAFHIWLALIISELVWSRLEILFLEVYWDNETVAMFTVGLAIASLATQGTLLLGGALMPHFSFLIGSGDLEGGAPNLRDRHPLDGRHGLSLLPRVRCGRPSPASSAVWGCVRSSRAECNCLAGVRRHCDPGDRWLGGCLRPRALRHDFLYGATGRLLVAQRRLFHHSDLRSLGRSLGSLTHSTHDVGSGHLVHQSFASLPRAAVRRWENAGRRRSLRGLGLPGPYVTSRELGAVAGDIHRRVGLSGFYTHLRVTDERRQSDSAGASPYPVCVVQARSGLPSSNCGSA